MGTVSFTPVSDGTTGDAADVNTPLTTIYNEFNGNIDNNNIKTTAAIDGSKLANSSVSASKLATGASTATVATSETTISTSFAALATAGPAVTVTIGANGLALVILSAQTTNSNTSGYAIMGFAVSGATTTASSDTYSLRDSTPAAGQTNRFSNVFLVTGLTAGSTTFTAQYKALANTATFSGRVISVIPL
jgi:hypothetical protein